MNQISSKSRIEFIDLAKGFCIILVVLFHVMGGVTNLLLIRQSVLSECHYTSSSLDVSSSNTKGSLGL